MKQLLTIIFITFCFWGHSQYPNLYVMNNTGVAIEVVAGSRIGCLGAGSSESHSFPATIGSDFSYSYLGIDYIWIGISIVGDGTYYNPCFACDTDTGTAYIVEWVDVGDDYPCWRILIHN